MLKTVARHSYRHLRLLPRRVGIITNGSHHHRPSLRYIPRTFYCTSSNNNDTQKKNGLTNKHPLSSSPSSSIPASSSSINADAKTEPPSQSGSTSSLSPSSMSSPPTSSSIVPATPIMLEEKSLFNKSHIVVYRFDKDDAVEAKRPFHKSATLFFKSFYPFLKSCYLPEGYPHSVTADYTRYQSWIFAQNLAQSTTYVLSTTAIFAALGIGSASVPVASAAMLWLMREALSPIGATLFAGKYANTLDADTKRSKFLADIAHTVGLGVEIIILPIAGNFLVIASCTNLLKACAGLAQGATRASLHKMFSLKHNMADITAKSQSQNYLSYLIGLFLGSGFLHVLSEPYMYGVVCFGFAAFQISASYMGLRSVTLNTLNDQRSRIVINSYFLMGAVIAPDVARQSERILFRKEEHPKIHLGASVKDTFNDASELKSSIAAHQNTNYLLHYNDNNKSIFIVLHKDSSPLDQLQALFHACYVRSLLCCKTWLAWKGLHGMDDPKWVEKVDQWHKSTNDTKGHLPPGWLERSLDFVMRNFDAFAYRLGRAGWNMSAILLNVQPLRSTWQRPVMEQSDVAAG